MPLLKGRSVAKLKPLGPLKPNEAVFTIPHTGEEFKSKEYPLLIASIQNGGPLTLTFPSANKHFSRFSHLREFDKRVALYEDRVWTCQCTGQIKLTHKEASESERKVHEFLEENFPKTYEKAVLEIVHHSTDILDNLTDAAWKKIHQELFEGEEVELTVKGENIRGVITKVERSTEAGNGSNCSSPSSNKENNQEEAKLLSLNKVNHPKLLPFKYGFRICSEDKVINGVPAEDLTRVRKPPTVDLVKMFIRAKAVRGGNANSRWVVEESLAKEHLLQNKFADFFVSPTKMAEMGRKAVDGKRKLTQSKLTDAPLAKKSKTEPEPKKKPGRPRKNDSPKKKVVLGEDGSPIKRGRGRPRKDGSPVKTSPRKMSPRKTPIVIKDSSDSEDDLSLSKLKEIVLSDESEDNVVLAKLAKKKISPKKRKRSEKLKQMTLDDMRSKKSPRKATPKKGTPLKRSASKSPSKSAYRLPPIAMKVKKILNTQGVCPVYHQALHKCAKVLSKAQILKLPDYLQAPVMRSFEKLEEKKMLEKMTPQEREEYKQKKKEENLRKAQIAARKKWKESNMKFEDTELDLQPLPAPKIVPTPDGVPNELFGDVAMVMQFISTFRGLLMPDSKETIVKTNELVNSLVGGQRNFQTIARNLMVLLQTLLQDELAEDYSDLNVPLSSLQVTNFTAAELTRLCLRKKDLEDGQTALDEEEEEELHDDMPEELMEKLESGELYDLDADDKLNVILGLCHRVMCTYSVQDYLEGKQQLASELWRRRIASQKQAKKERKADELKTGKKGRGRPFKREEEEQEQEEDKSKELTIKSFYGNQVTEDLDAEADLATVVKRRRILSAKAAEEKSKKEQEKKQKLELEINEQKKQIEHEAVEREFCEGTALAKLVLRHAPIGTDRHHSRYWVFDQSVTPGLYVEKGWAPKEMTYCTKTGSSCSSESDSDSEIEETKNGKRKKWGHVRDLYEEKTFPHVGQNLWFHFDSISEVDDLIQNLHPLGIREAALKKELKKHRDDIVSGLTKTAAATEVKTEEKGDVPVSLTGLEAAFREELLDVELRIRNGGLGGVTEYKLWETKVKTAESITDLGDCLIECQSHVLEKFMQGILVEKEKKAKSKVEVEKAEKEEEEDEEVIEIKEEAEEVFVGRVRWVEAVKSCTTWSRLHLLMSVMESCMKWEKSAENAKCKICRKKGEEEKVLLCDDCNQPFHLYCLRPALYEVPKGEWFCAACAPRTRRVKTNVNYRELAGEENDKRIVDSNSEEEREVDIVHEQECTMCGGDEGLVNCSTCVCAFHLECHDPPLRHIPRSIWRCSQCKSGVRFKKSRRVAATKHKWYNHESEDDDSDFGGPTKSSRRRKKRRSLTPDSDDYMPAVRSSSRRKYSPEVAERTSGRSTRRSLEVVSEVEDDDEDEVMEITPPKPTKRVPPKATEENTRAKELKNVQVVLSRLRRNKNGWPFNEPVNPIEVPDYLTIVKKPMDLQTIDDKYVSDVYKTAQEFIDDVTLMFNNCDLYNKSDSIVGKCLPPLERTFKDCIVRYFPHCKYSRDLGLNVVTEEDEEEEEGGGGSGSAGGC
ncbi:hypothetical protein CAPTEDRAFT_216422 [Capitella teleta]|uniref:Tyrosine-protein kinase BAZ1B n=1 Tax=Capitella teleta TaxID=283909 RepID=R7TLB8_CAPTE|nr:hypothetical protein CAPTEDRAFT_216422 [Capitella teleta]|eukprot:ELT91900.1 hypothetical protein CAPTEDRAFT_216422 [Capitella teleta]